MKKSLLAKIKNSTGSEQKAWNQNKIWDALKLSELITDAPDCSSAVCLAGRSGRGTQDVQCAFLLSLHTLVIVW